MGSTGDDVSKEYEKESTQISTYILLALDKNRSTFTGSTKLINQE